MAMSGTIYGDVTRNENKFDYYLVWDVINSEADRVANNRSQVRVQTYLYTHNTVYTFDTSVVRYHNTKIGSVQEEWNRRIDCNPWPSNPFLLHTFTRYVNHDEDGTKTIVISGYVDAHASSYGADDCWAEEWVTLDPISQNPEPDAESLVIAATAYNPTVVSGTGANAVTAMATATAPDDSANTGWLPGYSPARALGYNPQVGLNGVVPEQHPSVLAVENGIQSLDARTAFPCAVPQAASPGDVMLFILQYHESHTNVPAEPPVGTWAERTRGSVNGDSALWVWERQVQPDEPGSFIEATTNAAVDGVAAIMVLSNASYGSSGTLVEKATPSTSVTVGGVVPKDNSLLVEIATHRKQTASTTPASVTSEAPEWVDWIEHPNHAGGTSQRHSTIYAAVRELPTFDFGFESSVDDWITPAGTLGWVKNKSAKGRASCLYTSDGSGGGAATAMLSATKGCWIDSFDTNRHDSSGQIRIRAGDARRGLLEFNLSSLPGDAVITSAKLRLKTESTSGDDPTGRSYQVNRMTTTSWTVNGQYQDNATSGATWSHANYSTVPWTTAGGDFTTTGQAVFAAPAVGDTVEVDLLTLANDAIASRAGILSLLIRDAVNDGSNGQTYFGGPLSAGSEPSLVVEYTTLVGATPGFESKHRIPVVPGEVYTVSGYANPVQAMPNGIGVTANWYDASGTLLSYTVTSRVPEVSRWNYFEEEFIAPSDAVEASVGMICLGQTNLGDRLYADEVRISPIGPWHRTLSENTSDLSLTLEYQPLTAIKRLAEFQFHIDWDNDGDWGDPDEDVTGRVLERSAISVKYGRDQIRALSPMAPGQASFELNNLSRDYYPDNMDSPLNGFVEPARPVRIRAFNGKNEFTLFQGFVDGFDLDPTPGTRSVDVSCVDGLVTLSDAKVSTEIYPSIRTGDAIHKVLDEVGWPADARDIDPGATIMRWWAAEGKAVDVVESIVASEGPPALITIAPSGAFIFRDRHHRLLRPESVTSQATFRDKGSEPLFSAPLTYDHGWRDIVNTVEFDVTEIQVSGVLSDVWDGGSNVYAIASGQSIEVEAVAEKGFIGAYVPKLNVDYTVISGAVDITLSRTSGRSTKIRISGVGGSAASITNLKLRAFPVVDGPTRRVKVSDASSIAKYKVRAGTSFEANEATYEDALAIGRTTLAQRAERLPIVTFPVKRKDDDITRYIHMLERDISDRVSIVDSETGLNADLYIERIEHSISSLGHFHTTTFGCEKVAGQPSGVLQLDAGMLDVGTLGRDGLDNPNSIFVLDQQNVLDLHILGN